MTLSIRERKPSGQESATRRESADPPAIDAIRGMDDMKRWLAWWCREKVNREWSSELARTPPFPVGWRLTISFITAMAVDSHICKYTRRDRLTKIRVVIKKNGFEKFIVMAICRQYYGLSRLGGLLNGSWPLRTGQAACLRKVASSQFLSSSRDTFFFFSFAIKRTLLDSII